MEKFNFDEKINRFATDSIKWDAYEDTVIPLWVADMDFRSPPCIKECFDTRINHEVYGYTHQPKGFKEDIVQHLYEQYRWQVEPDWIVIMPSVVSALYAIGKNCTSNQAHIITPNPVYHHLRIAAEESGRDYSEAKLENINNRLLLTSNSLEQVCKRNTELLYFCNPHNPGGTVYSKNELEKIIDFSITNNITICSDEIHAGLVLDESSHIPIASIHEEASNHTITLMSLNKTYNFPGAGLAWAVIKNKELRDKTARGIGNIIPDPHLFSYIATKSVLDHGNEWRIALLNYLRQNRQLLIQAVKKMSGLHMYAMQASYLGWLSCEHIDHIDPFKLFLKNGVALQPGHMFNSKGHVRINIATPKSNLNEALLRMSKAISENAREND